MYIFTNIYHHYINHIYIYLYHWISPYIGARDFESLQHPTGRILFIQSSFHVENPQKKIDEFRICHPHIYRSKIYAQSFSWWHPVAISGAGYGRSCSCGQSPGQVCHTARALGGHLSYCRFSNSSTNFFSIRSISFLRGTLHSEVLFLKRSVWGIV